MRRRIPPLATLRPFEPAARHGSFTLAAHELSLTQSAVSQQVRNLEDFLGVKLFERQTRKLRLSDAGRQYLQSVQQALDSLELGTSRVLARGARETVNLSVMPTLATVWLMPRLAPFAAEHPGIDLRLATSIEPADLHGGAVDIALRVGRLPGRSYPRERARIDLIMTERWEGLLADELFPDALVPVALAGLLEAGPPIKRSAGEYYLLTHESQDASAAVQTVRSWLLAQAAATREQYDLQASR